MTKKDDPIWTLNDIAREMTREIGRPVSIADVKIMLGRVMVQNQIADCLRTYFGIDDLEEEC
jgi:hypothetical protein